MQYSVLLVVLWMGFVPGSSDIDALMEFKGFRKIPQDAL